MDKGLCGRAKWKRQKKRLDDFFEFAHNDVIKKIKNTKNEGCCWTKLTIKIKSGHNIRQTPTPMNEYMYILKVKIRATTEVINYNKFLTKRQAFGDNYILKLLVACICMLYYCFRCLGLVPHSLTQGEDRVSVLF